MFEVNGHLCSSTSWSSPKSPISVKAGTACKVSCSSLCPHYCAATWGPFVWKLRSKLIDRYCNTYEVVNTLVSWKLVPISNQLYQQIVWFTPQQMIRRIRTKWFQQWSVRLRWIIFNLYHWCCHIGYVILSHFSCIWKEISSSHRFWIQTFHIGLGLNPTNQTKLDFVDFLWLPLSLVWSV